MRFRLFRSRGFWFGRVGLVFLLWAWGDSFTHRARIGFASPGWAEAGSVQGELYLAKERGVRVNWENPERWYYRSKTDPMLQRLPGITAFVVPYWVVVSLYLLAWNGLKAWRAWRARRHRTVPEGPER